VSTASRAAHRSCQPRGHVAPRQEAGARGVAVELAADADVERQHHLPEEPLGVGVAVGRRRGAGYGRGPRRELRQRRVRGGEGEGPHGDATSSSTRVKRRAGATWCRERPG
jgi:hypothetical protein